MRNNYSYSVVLFLVALMVLIGYAQGMDTSGGEDLSQEEAYNLVLSDVLKGNTNGIWVFAAPDPVAAGTSIDTWYGDSGPAGERGMALLHRRYAYGELGAPVPVCPRGYDGGSHREECTWAPRGSLRSGKRWEVQVHRLNSPVVEALCPFNGWQMSRISRTVFLHVRIRVTAMQCLSVEEPTPGATGHATMVISSLCTRPLYMTTVTRTTISMC